MAIEKRKFEVTVSVDSKTKQAALRADLKKAVGEASGSEKVSLKPITAAKKPARKTAAKKPVRKTAVRKAA